MKDYNDALVQQALDALQAAAASHSEWRTHDPVVRYAYRRLIRTMSDQIWKQYKAGKLTANEAAQAAQEARNFILDVSRALSTPEGRAAAQAMKKNGRTFGSLLERYSLLFFKRPFQELEEAEQGKVFEELIRSAGRSQKVVDEGMRDLAATSRLFWVLTILMAAYDISTARDKVSAAVHDLTVVGGAIIGGEILGGVIGSLGGPIGTGFGVVVGGILGGWMVDHFMYDDANPAMTGE